ncbi:MAG: hypothetical protein ACE5JG_10525 [Planctomycetota bacterium]
MDETKPGPDPAAACGETMESMKVGGDACPMGAMCRGMMGKKPGFLPMAPGLVFVIAGALILIEPRVLVWLVGVASVLLGLLLILLVWRLRRHGARTGTEPAGEEA